mmetsp:Transcript_42534/g.40792  ORF Transcript_42534/g.40792 Transcript_42534/m.40792 type:complete len:84 (-) Transcript_42534:195-446(-)
MVNEMQMIIQQGLKDQIENGSEEEDRKEEEEGFNEERDEEDKEVNEINIGEQVIKGKKREVKGASFHNTLSTVNEEEEPEMTF